MHSDIKTFQLTRLMWPHANTNFTDSFFCLFFFFLLIHDFHGEALGQQHLNLPEGVWSAVLHYWKAGSAAFHTKGEPDRKSPRNKERLHRQRWRRPCLPLHSAALLLKSFTLLYKVTCVTLPTQWRSCQRAKSSVVVHAGTFLVFFPLVPCHSPSFISACVQNTDLCRTAVPASGGGEQKTWWKL